MKTLFLLPSSQTYPKLGKDMVTGFKTYFKKQQPDTDIEIQIEGIGKGTDTENILNTIQKSIISDDIDLIVNYSIPLTEESILHYAQSFEIPLLSIDSGAIFSHEPKLSDNYFKINLNLGKEAYAIGHHIASKAQNNDKILTFSSFNNSGYHFLSALEKGITIVKEKNVHITHSVVHQDHASLSWESTFKIIKEEKPGFIYLSLNKSEDFETFFDFLANENLTDSTQLFTYSLAVDSLIKNWNNKIVVYSATNWLPEDDADMKIPLEVLGFEAAITAHSIHHKKDLNGIQQDLLENSPRSWLAENGTILPDFNLRKTYLNGDGILIHEKTGRLLNDSFKNLPDPAFLGGWHNPFLCAEH